MPTISNHLKGGPKVCYNMFNQQSYMEIEPILDTFSRDLKSTAISVESLHILFTSDPYSDVHGQIDSAIDADLGYRLYGAFVPTLPFPNTSTLGVSGVKIKASSTIICVIFSAPCMEKSEKLFQLQRAFAQCSLRRSRKLAGKYSLSIYR